MKFKYRPALIFNDLVLISIILGVTIWMFTQGYFWLLIPLIPAALIFYILFATFLPKTEQYEITSKGISIKRRWFKEQLIEWATVRKVILREDHDSFGGFRKEIQIYLPNSIKKIELSDLMDRFEFERLVIENSKSRFKVIRQNTEGKVTSIE